MRLFSRRGLLRITIALGVSSAAFCIWFWAPWFRETYIYPVPPTLAQELQVPPATIAVAPFWRGQVGADQPTAEDVAKFYSHWSRIQSEIATLVNHPWAGQYRAGYPSGKNMVLAPGGYAALGNVVDKEQRLMFAYMDGGEVSAKDGHVELQTGDILYPATWGKRHYLLSGEQLEAIREHLTRHLFAQDLMLRVGDEKELEDQSKGWILPAYAGESVEYGVLRSSLNSLFFRFRHSTEIRPIPESFLYDLPGSRGREDWVPSSYWTERPPPIVPDSWSAEQQPFFIWRRNALLGEVANTQGHSWAGKYILGHGEDEPDSILIASHRGALLTLHWIAGDLSCGRGLFFADPVDEGLRLRLTNGIRLTSNDDGIDCYKTPPVPYLFPVQIGERHFMLYGGELVGLLNLLNGEDAPDSSYFAEYLVRDGEQNKSLVGPRMMAAPYVNYLHPTPLEGKVIAASSKFEEGNSGGPFTLMPTCEQSVTLNLSKGQGVFEGMRLYAVDGKDGWEIPITVDRIEANKAEAYARLEAGFKCKDLKSGFGRPLLVGQKISSRRPVR